MSCGRGSFKFTNNKIVHDLATAATILWNTSVKQANKQTRPRWFGNGYNISAEFSHDLVQKSS
jgi:hypothetical protein